MGEHSEEMIKRYTLQDIEKHWTDYSSKRAMRVLINGKWELRYPVNADILNGEVGTRREMVFLKQVVSFPTYLRKYTEA